MGEKLLYPSPDNRLLLAYTISLREYPLLPHPCWWRSHPKPQISQPGALVQGPTCLARPFLRWPEAPWRCLYLFTPSINIYQHYQPTWPGCCDIEMDGIKSLLPRSLHFNGNSNGVVWYLVSYPTLRESHHIRWYHSAEEGEPIRWGRVRLSRKALQGK